MRISPASASASSGSSRSPSTAGYWPAYDEAAARAYGELMGERRELGRPMSVPDGQIAAIARSAHLSVATRSVSDFERCGIELVDPFLEMS